MLFRDKEQNQKQTGEKEMVRSLCSDAPLLLGWASVSVVISLSVPVISVAGPALGRTNRMLVEVFRRA